jgi:putative oxidoreductase
MKTNTAPASVSSSTQAHETQLIWVNRGFITARILLGALLLFGVTNAIFNFAPQPPLPQGAQAFMGGLFSAPYFFVLLKGTELFVALALLTNRLVPLALVVLAPITVNIALFHLVLAPAGAPLAIALLAFHLTTAWSRRENFRSVLAVK